MLTQLHVRGYKALRDISTTLEPLTVIVGPNGCGKTSVLDAIALVRDLLAGSDDAAPGGHPFEELLSKGDDLSSEIAVELWARLGLDDQDRVAKVVLQDDARLSAEAIRKIVERELRVETRRKVDESQWTVAKTFPWPHGHELQHQLFGSCFRGVRRLDLSAKVIAQPSYSQEILPQVGTGGEGLATVLAWLQGEQYEKFEEIQASLRKFIPEIERLRFRRAPVYFLESHDVPIGQDEDGRAIYTKRSTRRKEIGNEILFDFQHAKGVPARHASEGTLLLLGLIAVTLTDDASVLLLDDVDRALHPKAQQQLIAYLRGVTEQGIQVIATSHSPYLVLHLEYEEIRAMTMSDSGAGRGSAS